MTNTSRFAGFAAGPPHVLNRSGAFAWCGRFRCSLMVVFVTALANFCTLAQQPAPAPAAAAGDNDADTVAVDAATEHLIGGALRFLAKAQQGNGSWSVRTDRRGEHPVAMTGYVLLAFMAAGNLPEQGEYGKEVYAGMQFLVDSIQADGIYRGVDGGKYMYNHGIATIALAELYGETRNADLRAKLQRAIDLIVGTQSTQGPHTGGWRYHPRPEDADISVTVLQVVALRSARNAGIAVPQETISRAIEYVKRCFDPGTGGFGYQPRGSPGFARTAAAIYSLQVCGLYEDPLVKAGVNFIFGNCAPDEAHWTYGCNYAGPALYMVGGESWRRWYGMQKNHLLGTVKRDGTLCWWDGEVGPVYCTAAYTTILSMPWHAIPLYQR